MNNEPMKQDNNPNRELHAALFLKKHAPHLTLPIERLRGLLHAQINQRGGLAPHKYGKGLELFHLVRRNRYRNGDSISNYFREHTRSDGTLSLGTPARDRLGRRFLRGHKPKPLDKKQTTTKH